MCRQVQERRIPIFIVSYPATIHPTYTALAQYGAAYAVVENHSGRLHPLTHLQEILANIISRTESETVEKLHEAHYNSLAFAGTFTYDKEETGGDDLIITLNVPDEEKVEYFEVKDPSGKKRIFSKFEDGMVYFKFSGHLPSGIWSYHAKLYHDSVFPETKMLVDVVTKSDSQTGIVVDVYQPREQQQQQQQRRRGRSCREGGWSSSGRAHLRVCPHYAQRPAGSQRGRHGRAVHAG